jgi:malate dehydrogenase
MSSVAILGAGDLGGAIAHALAGRGRVREVTIVDDQAGVAAGKALDLMQASPIDRVDVRIGSAGDLLAAAGAKVIVLADAVATGEWHGEAALALVDRLLRAGSQATFVFAGAKQVSLMTAAVREVKLAADRAVATAASATVGSVRTLVGLDLDGSGAGVSIVVSGCPPKSIIAWSSATADGAPLGDRVPAHRQLAIRQTLGTLWPPTPRAVAAPTARIVEALVEGSRHLHQAVTVLDGEFGRRGGAAMLPLRFAHGRIAARVVPALSPQELTATINAIFD